MHARHRGRPAAAAVLLCVLCVLPRQPEQVPAHLPMPLSFSLVPPGPPPCLPPCPRSFPCAQYTNPTDHFLSVLRDSKAAETVVAAYAASPEALALGGPASGQECDVEAGLSGKHDAAAASSNKTPLARAASDAAAVVEAERPHVPFAFQTWVLSLRMLRNWGRNPVMLAAEGVQVGLGRPGWGLAGAGWWGWTGQRPCPAAEPAAASPAETAGPSLPRTAPPWPQPPSPPHTRARSTCSWRSSSAWSICSECLRAARCALRWRLRPLPFFPPPSLFQRL